LATSSSPQFSYELEISGDTTTVKCHGRIISDTATEIKDLVKPMIPKCRRIVLDLTRRDLCGQLWSRHADRTESIGWLGGLLRVELRQSFTSRERLD
jgi:hypothetical protein